MPAKRRRLSDLYVVGKPFKIGDAEGAIEVWLQKINPLERELAVRAAGAARARTLAFIEDKDSDEYMSKISDVIDFYGDRDSLVMLATHKDLIAAKTRIEAETAADERWSKDGFLLGLVDSWQDEMMDRYNADPHDKEAKKVFDLIKKYEDEVTKVVEEERVRLERDCADYSMTKLREIGAEKLIEAQANNAFIDEFEVQRLLFAVREPGDHSAYYFADRGEVRALDERVRVALSEAYNALEVDVVEGKDLPETDDSSPSSEPSEAAAPVPASGPKGA